MANVYADLMGVVKKLSVSTVGEAATQMGAGTGYQAMVNGDTVSFDTPVEENDVIIFSQAVKGGC